MEASLLRDQDTGVQPHNFDGNVLPSHCAMSGHTMLEQVPGCRRRGSWFFSGTYYCTGRQSSFPGSKSILPRCKSTFPRRLDLRLRNADLRLRGVDSRLGREHLHTP